MLNKTSNFSGSTADESTKLGSTLKDRPPESFKRTSFMKRLLRFRLRTMLLLILFASGWLVWHLERAKKQKHAVDWVINAGGAVWYDFQSEGEPAFGIQSKLRNAESPYPKFMIDALGYDFFHSAIYVDLINPENCGRQNRNLKTEWAEHLGGFKNLQEAFIQGNLVDDEVLKQLGKLKHLKIVDVDGPVDSITDKGMENLVKSRKIEQIYVSDSSLTDDSLRHLSTLPNIYAIGFDGNCLSDEGLGYLRDKTMLMWLSISGSQKNITNRGLKELYRLKNLEYLDI